MYHNLRWISDSTTVNGRAGINALFILIHTRPQIYYVHFEHFE